METAAEGYEVARISKSAAPRVCPYHAGAGGPLPFPAIIAAPQHVCHARMCVCVRACVRACACVCVRVCVLGVGGWVVVVGGGGGGGGHTKGNKTG